MVDISSSSRGNVKPKTGSTNWNAQRYLPDKGHAIKWCCLYNSWNVGA